MPDVELGFARDLLWRPLEIAASPEKVRHTSQSALALDGYAVTPQSETHYHLLKSDIGLSRLWGLLPPVPTILTTWADVTIHLSSRTFAYQSCTTLRRCISSTFTYFLLKHNITMSGYIAPPTPHKRRLRVQAGPERTALIRLSWEIFWARVAWCEQHDTVFDDRRPAERDTIPARTAPGTVVNPSSVHSHASGTRN